MTAFPYMANLARKYLRDEYSFQYKKSLFSMKPILMSSETVYDLDEVLERV